MHKTLDVITIGEAMAMFVATETGELSAVEHFIKRVAGAELNVATGLARLGLNVGWVSRVGNDSFGHFVLDSLKKEGIDAAGVTLDQLARALGHDRKIVRAMPNTPSLVNAGMTSVTPNALVTSEDVADVLNIFRCFGEAEVIAEPMIHPVVGVSGSAPAYVFMFIEAMADAAVLGGMPRAQAYKFAAQAVMGSAKMVLETGKHPGELKDMVCSPGGTTIEAVRVLEDRGFRSAVIEAMQKCMEKSEKLSKS